MQPKGQMCTLPLPTLEPVSEHDQQVDWNVFPLEGQEGRVVRGLVLRYPELQVSGHTEDGQKKQRDVSNHQHCLDLNSSCNSSTVPKSFNVQLAAIRSTPFYRRYFTCISKPLPLTRSLQLCSPGLPGILLIFQGINSLWYVRSILFRLLLEFIYFFHEL